MCVASLAAKLFKLNNRPKGTSLNEFYFESEFVSMRNLLNAMQSTHIGHSWFSGMFMLTG